MDPLCYAFKHDGNSKLLLYKVYDGADWKGGKFWSEETLLAQMTVSSKKASGTNPIGLTAVANIFTGMLVFLLPPVPVSEIADMTRLDWKIILILGAVQVGGGYAFYNLGVQRILPHKASIIALWELILGPIWVALFLREYPSLMVWIGLAIILLGMVLEVKMSQLT